MPRSGARCLAGGAVLGALMAVAAGWGAFYEAAVRGWLPANADAKPPALEKWIANKALDAVILREAPTRPNPLKLDDRNLIGGIRLYAANCAVCHGASDGRPSRIASGLYQKAPQLARYGVEDDEDGDVYWKVAHGIRMTGMPSFNGSLADRQIWQIVLFLKNMDSLPPEAQKAWEAVPSAAPRAVAGRGNSTSSKEKRS